MLVSCDEQQDSEETKTEELQSEKMQSQRLQKVEYIHELAPENITVLLSAEQKAEVLRTVDGAEDFISAGNCGYDYALTIDGEKILYCTECKTLVGKNIKILSDDANKRLNEILDSGR